MKAPHTLLERARTKGLISSWQERDGVFHVWRLDGRQTTFHVGDSSWQTGHMPVGWNTLVQEYEDQQSSDGSVS